MSGVLESADDLGERPRSAPRRVDRVGLAALLLVPGVGVAALAFRGGGFFPDATAVAAIAVLVAVLLRVTLASAPLEAVSLPLAVGVIALGGLAAWTLMSAGWSDSASRASLEYGRTLLYVAVLVLFATVAPGERRARLLLCGLAAAALVVMVGALAVWFVPDRFGVGPGFPRARLTWPTSYWNATGLLAGLGVVWGIALCSSLRAHAAVRVLGATAAPLGAAVLYLTVSRGAVGATAVGLVVLVVANRSWGLLSAAVATVPTAALAVVVASRASGLDTVSPTAAALQRGERAAWGLLGLALAAALVRGVLLLLDRRLVRLRVPAPRPRSRVLIALAVVAAVVAAGVAADAPSRVERGYESFAHGGSVPNDLAPSRRFGAASNNGRIDHWRAAVDAGFKPHPVRGGGAGTYALMWARERSSAFTVIDAHSLYVEMLGELGLVGLVLLLVALAVMLGALVARAAARGGGAWAGLLAGAVVWAVHAGIDWDWEMPALTLPMFAAGGLALGRRAVLHVGRFGGAARIGVGLACLLLALLPVAIVRSQRHLDDALAAIEAGDCRRAAEAALAARAALSARPEPFELLAYCDVRGRRLRLAVRAIGEAARRDPHNWEFRYDQAIVRAAAGRSTRAAVAKAVQLNPRHPYVVRLRAMFADGEPADWRRRALAAPLLVPAGG